MFLTEPSHRGKGIGKEVTRMMMCYGEQFALCQKTFLTLVNAANVCVVVYSRGPLLWQFILLNNFKYTIVTFKFYRQWLYVA